MSTNRWATYYCNYSQFPSEANNKQMFAQTCVDTRMDKRLLRVVCQPHVTCLVSSQILTLTCCRGSHGYTAGRNTYMLSYRRRSLKWGSILASLRWRSKLGDLHEKLNQIQHHKGITCREQSFVDKYFIESDTTASIYVKKNEASCPQTTERNLPTVIIAYEWARGRKTRCAQISAPV